MIVLVSEVTKQPTSLSPTGDWRRFYSRSRVHDSKTVQLFVFPNNRSNTHS